MRKKPNSALVTKFYEIAPFLFGLIYVSSGWDWDNVPDWFTIVFFMLTQRGSSIWLMTGIFYFSKADRPVKDKFKFLLEILFIGSGFYITTRVGYGSLLRSIQWEGPFIQHAWGWFQAVLMGISWSLSILSVLIILDQKLWKSKSRKNIVISIIITVISLILNLVIPELNEDLKKLVDIIWIFGLYLASIPILTLLDKEYRRFVLVVIVINVITFLIGAIITSYYEPPSYYAIDRHKIAELTWGFGHGLGLSYVFRQHFETKADEEEDLSHD